MAANDKPLDSTPASAPAAPVVPPTAAYPQGAVEPATKSSWGDSALLPAEPPTLDDDRSHQDSTFEVCQRIGPYEVLEELAKGGMGMVFKVRDTRLGRVVALKMVRGSLVCGMSELLRFQREAKVQAQIRHQHILSVYDAGEHQGEQYFTMPLVPGGSLDKRMKEFAGQPKRVVPLLEKVVRAVAYAHEQGILHRDLKPSNILLDAEDEPLIADFGLAKLVDASFELTANQVLGTPPYMAPEQTDADLAHLVDVRTDVWSLGVVLYELLTGQRPFQGANKTETLARVRNVNPLPPRSIKPDLDADLEKIILRCLEKEQEYRYPSAAALADDLARWQQGAAIPAVPLSQRVRRTARRVPWTKVVVATSILLLACLCIGLALRPQPRAVVGLPTVPAPLQPVEPTYWEKLREQLQLGRTVQLFGEKENPRKIGQSFGGILADIRREGDERYDFFFWSPSRYRLELIPPGFLPSRYRIRLELMQDLPDDAPPEMAQRGTLGIYALHHRLTLAGGRVADTYVTLTIGRHGTVERSHQDPRLASVCYLWCHFLPLKNWPGGLTEAVWNANNPIPPGPEARHVLKKWRTMVLEVRPTEVRAYLDNVFLFKAAHKVALLPARLQPLNHQATRQAPFSWEDAPHAFAPSGGMGLYVDSACMFARNLVIEPLND